MTALGTGAADIGPGGIPRPGEDEPIRVMIVDDSAVIRRVVKAVLSAEADLEVVGAATNGREAVALVAECHPHLVVMDVEMPVMDGLAALRAIRPQWPALPVIMFSTLTQRGAAATIEALSIGASDYATKPSSATNLDATVATMQAQLVPLVRSWGEVGRRREPTTKRAVRTTPAVAKPVETRPPLRPARPITPGTVARKVDALVIGCSAGGPNALAELVPRLPGDFPVPILLTQHMPETFTAMLAARLNDLSALTVVEADEGMTVHPGHAYIAKGGWHMVFNRAGAEVAISLNDGAPENFCRPAVDVMFRSAVRVWGRSLLGVVLTGMGRDGAEGAKAITAGGGTVITQDEESCLVWGMPGAVVAAGASSAEYTLTDLAPEICRRVIGRAV